tara:strand:- start:888 stop:1094 length:207 start_codon:yes stop_codon:yes gene_type:complete
MTAPASEKKTVKKTLSQLSDHNLQAIIDAQKEKIRKGKFKNIGLVLEKNKLAKMQQELDKRHAKKKHP